MARLILEAAGEDVTVGASTGVNVNVIGSTEGGEVLTVVSGGGTVTLDASYVAGGDTIELPGEAEDYTATLNGSRVILTNGAGISVSIPVGPNGIDVEFGGDDTRSLRVADGAVVFGEQTVAAEGETQLDPGTDEIATLTQALQNLQATQDALNEFLGDSTAADIVAARDAAQAALDADLLEGTDLQLEADVVSAEADVAAAEDAIAAVDGLAEAIAAYEAAEAELNVAASAQLAAAADLAGAVAAYNVLHDPDVTVNADGTVDGLIVLNAEGELVIDDGVTVTPELTELLEATIANEAAEAVLAEAQATRDEALADLEALDPGQALYGDLQAAEAALVAAEANVDERAELRADLAEAQAQVDELNELEDAIEDAEAVVEGLGYDVPVTVADGDAVAGDAVGGAVENDIFVLDTGTGVGAATVADFGAEGDDILFVGSGYTTVNLAAGVDLAGTNQGDVAGLEVFIQQVGDDTVLYFEDEAFAGSSSDGTFEGFIVTLTDVDAADVSLDATGYITIEDGAMA